MSSEIAINVVNLSKCYHIYQTPRDRLRQFIYPRLRSLFGLYDRSYRRELWVLKNISFQVKKGESIGIVGRNGSGKSTLLQIVCGTLASTSGHVRTHGRIAALLELGSGFNPELSGIENVYMNGAILGLTREEIDAKFDEIAAFADIGGFIEAPVKTYSSGMVIRLAFAVSASVSPEILVVDEALAVGDIRFQAKCFNRIRKLRDEGTTLLFVSHSMDQIVKHCDRGILLEGGRIVGFGSPKDISNQYMDLLYGPPATSVSQDSSEIKPEVEPQLREEKSGGLFFSNCDKDAYFERLGWNPNEYRWGDGSARILDFKIVDGQGCHCVELNGNEKYLVAMKVFLGRRVDKPVFGFYIKTIDGFLVTGSNSRDFPDDELLTDRPDGYVGMFEVNFSFEPHLVSGSYMISLGVAEDVGGELVPLDRRYDSILVHIFNPKPYFGLVDLGMRCLVRDMDSN
jgi:lipopolysaccharide transport system ATP-binding protein